MYYYNKTSKRIATLDVIRKEYPTSSFPVGADLSFIDWYMMEDTDAPEFDDVTQGILLQAGEKQVNGKTVYFKKWFVYPLDATQIEANKKKKEEQLKDHIMAIAQSRLDAFAKSRGYDSIQSACTYVGSPAAKFDQEARRCLELRSLTWANLYQLMDDVTNGIKSMPDDITSVLPELIWE